MGGYTVCLGSNRLRLILLPVSTLTMLFSTATGNASSARAAGEWITLPVMSKAEAWQGQMNFFSFSTHGTVHPRWVLLH